MKLRWIGEKVQSEEIAQELKSMQEQKMATLQKCGV